MRVCVWVWPPPLWRVAAIKWWEARPGLQQQQQPPAGKMMRCENWQPSAGAGTFPSSRSRRAGRGTFPKWHKIIILTFPWFVVKLTKYRVFHVWVSGGLWTFYQLYFKIPKIQNFWQLKSLVCSFQVQAKLIIQYNTTECSVQVQAVCSVQV